MVEQKRLAFWTECGQTALLHPSPDGMRFKSVPIRARIRIPSPVQNAVRVVPRPLLFERVGRGTLSFLLTASLFLVLLAFAQPVQAQQISLGIISKDVGEGDGENRYSVCLRGESSGDVTVEVQSQDTGRITVAPSMLTLSDSNRCQEVTATGGTDDDQDDNNVEISHVASGGSSPEYRVSATMRLTEGICGRSQVVKDYLIRELEVSGIACGDVSDELLGRIVSVSLTGKGITELKAGDFDGLTNLWILSLDKNNLTGLPAGIFDDLRSLVELNLQFNRLSRLPRGLFDELTSLEVLNLHYNQLSSLPAGIFSGIKSDKLRNSWNRGFPGGDGLTTISLNNNNFTSLPAGLFSGLGGLARIFLENNQLTSLPAPIFSGLTDLYRIHLNGNRLTAVGLPDRIFSGLRSLRAFYLQDNPEWIEIPVLVEKVREAQGGVQFKTKIRTAAPFEIKLQLSVENGDIVGVSCDASNHKTAPCIPTIPQGAMESAIFTVTPTGPASAVTVNIEEILRQPGVYDLDNNIRTEGHIGYRLVTSDRPGGLSPDDNLPPEFSGTTATRYVAENTGSGENVGAPVEATEPEGEDLTYSLGGTDADSLEIDSNSGQIKTKAALDYETKSSYSVTVTAMDPSSSTDTITVAIKVTNEEEDGTVTLSSVQPQVDTALTATLDDPDGSVSGVTWTWEKSSSRNNSWSIISVATNASYTPVMNDLGSYLRATASYTDGEGSGKIARGVSDNTVRAEPPSNSPPEFSGTTDTRSVAENTGSGENVGEPVTATDLDNDPLTYSFGGLDAAFFALADPTSGQIQTRAPLDYETRSSYSVMVIASDPSGESGTITVTINVQDVDESGSPPTDGNGAPGVRDAPQVPGAPTGLTATRGDAEVTLSWKAPDDGGSAITRYEYQDDGGAWASTDATSTTYTVTGLANGRIYKFKVRAVNGVGPGDESAPVIVTPATVPEAPGNLTATPGNAEVTLSWDAPDDDGGSAIERYEYKIDSGEWVSTGGTTTTYMVTGLASGQIYEFRVRAVNDVGPGAESAPVSVAPATVPGAPRNLTLTSGDQYMMLIWERPEDNGGLRITGYEYSQKEENGSFGEWTSIDNSAPGEANETSYAVTGLKNGTVYSFRVRAVNEVGPGDPSAEATAEVNTPSFRRARRASLNILPTFGRTMARNSVDALTWRLDSVLSGSFERTGMFRLMDQHAGLHEVLGTDIWDDPDQWEELSLEELLYGSSFIIEAGVMPRKPKEYPKEYSTEYPKEDSADENMWINEDEKPVVVERKGDIGFWGKADYNNLSVSGDELFAWDGKMVSGYMGVDRWVNEKVLTGLSVSLTKGNFDYTDATPGEEGRGDYYVKMLSVSPYVSWFLSNDVYLWSALGYGRGGIDIDDEEAQRVVSSDLSYKSVAVGGSGRLFDVGDTTFSLKSEAFKVWMDLEGDDYLIDELSVGVHQLRLSMEGSYEYRFASGTWFNPLVEVALRHDGGDGETGTGVEVGGGFLYENPNLGLSVSGRGRWLAAHSSQEFSQWGVGGAVIFDTGADKRGALFSVAPEWGDTSSGVEGLWERGVEGLSSKDGGDAGMHLDAEFGYGLSALGGDGLLTPYSGLRLGGDGRRQYRLGSRLDLGRSASLSLETERRQSDTTKPEHGIMLRGKLNF